MSDSFEKQDLPITFRSHTALLLSTALPFLRPPYRHPLELALKFLEFSETLRLYREFHGPGKPKPFFPPPEPPKEKDGLLGGLYTIITDPEGLLSSLSRVCTGSEREIISLFLNLIRAKKFYETYGSLLSSLLPGTDEASGADPLSEMLSGLSSNAEAGGGGLSSLLSALSLLQPDLMSAGEPPRPKDTPAGQNAPPPLPEEDGRRPPDSQKDAARAGEPFPAADIPPPEPPKDAAGTREPLAPPGGDSAEDPAPLQNVLSSMLNEEQREMLDLLKELFP